MTSAGGTDQSFAPREWQVAAFDAWSRDQHGVVRVVTGGGKTAFALMCISDFLSSAEKRQVLILVPTLSLLDQWYLDVRDFLKLRDDQIGLLSGDERPGAQAIVVIAVINSAREFSEAFSSVYDTMLVVDECHRAGSPMNARALRGTYSAALGLSATPERDYDEGFVEHVEPVLGPVIFDYSYRDAAMDGVIAPFSLENVRINLLPDEEKQYDKLTRSIARALRKAPQGDVDDGLRALLQKRAAVSARATMRVPASIRLAELHPHTRMIIFHERIDAANLILTSLSARGHRATAYHSEISADMRRENLRQFRLGIFDVLVCCRALDEGLNVPAASVAIIASSTASTRQRIQRLGRVLRAQPGKAHATVYTIFATSTEMERLKAEEKHLEGVTDVSWREIKVGNA